MRYCLLACLVAVIIAGIPGRMVLANAEAPPDALSLHRAIKKALAANPELAAFQAEIEKAKARRRQAGLYPNPELAFELEGFGGSGPFSGTENAERSFYLKQDILLGGKIGKRTRVAAEAIQKNRWQMKILEQDIRKGVKKAFVEVAGAQSAVRLQRDLVNLSTRVYDTVRQKADAGKVSPIEAVKAEIEMKNNRQSLQTLHRRLQSARKTLASFWKTAEPGFKTVASRLDQMPELPPFAALEAGLDKNPDIERFDAEKTFQKAQYDLERARRIPDLSLSGGYRQIPESDDTAFIAEISIPLKIFDRNQGEIEAARTAVDQVADRRYEALNRRRQQLNAAFQDALAARDEVLALKRDIIPATREVFSAKRQGYESGKFSFLELLDAQRVLFESQQRYNDARIRYHLAIAEIERLTGQPLAEASAKTQGAIHIEKKQGDRG
ncbi:MAG: TolC family protein [Desulfobacterales bacterium]|nr:TolC family protein [Desulfobacterales bacterium]